MRTVAAFGLGTGGTACEAAAALAAPHLAVPFWVGHGADVPAFVDGHTLVLAVSCVGGHRRATTAAARGRRRAARTWWPSAATAALARLAADAGLPGARSRPAGPPARAALAATTVPLLVALARAGLLPDPSASVDAAAAALGAPARRSRRAGRRRPRSWPAGIGRTIPLVYGAAGVAAWRRGGGRPR